ncbi:hypothetical protein Bpfe_011231, partial [Biomphalaria pfeifferi]
HCLENTSRVINDVQPSTDVIIVSKQDVPLSAPESISSARPARSMLTSLRLAVSIEQQHRRRPDGGSYLLLL